MRFNIINRNILLGLLLVAASALTACSKGNNPARAGGPPPPLVQVRALKTATLQDSIEYVGTLQAEQTLTLSPQTAGQIAKILVKPGDRVRKGQQIFYLTPNQNTTQVSSAEASVNAISAAQQIALKQVQAARTQVASARAQYDLNKVSNDRYQFLAAQGALARSSADQTLAAVKTQAAAVQNALAQLDAAQATYNQAVANVRKARADAQTARVGLNLTQIAAPIDGSVGNITLKPGDYVTIGQALTTINRNDAFDLQIPIPINYAGQLHQGLTVELLDPNKGDRLGAGNIYFVSSQTNSANQTIQTRAKFPNPNGKLRDGQYVRSRVIWKTQPGVLVPTEAVSPIGGQNFVYVATSKTDNGKTQTIASQVPVELGGIQGQGYQVLKGLKPGDRVIVSGVARLRNGSPIVPQETNPSTPPNAPPQS